MKTLNLLKSFSFKWLLWAATIVYFGTSASTDAMAAPLPPNLSTTDATTYYGAASAVVVSPNLVLTGGDVYNSAKVTIGAGFVSTDVLSFTPQHGITGTYNTGTGILTLSGSGTAAQYQDVLRSVTYRNTVTNIGSSSSRTINFIIGGALYNELNGHFYELIDNGSVINWSVAKSNAEAKTYFGLQGYLVTITTATENTFVSQKISSNTWMGASDSHTEGTWRWVSGPEGQENSGLGRHFSNQFLTGGVGGCSANQAPGANGYYAAWAGGEPNDCGGNEDVAHFIGSSGTWNDYPHSGGVSYYVVEYGGMPGDPTIQVTDDVALTVMPTPNYAPVMNATSFSLAGINEDATGTTPRTVSSIISGTYSDINGNTAGIAVTATSGSGQWQQSTDQVSWYGMDYNSPGGAPVSATNAKLLSPAMYVRFVPAANWNGTATISFRGWDQTSGSNLAFVNTSTNGGNTAYSSELATLSVAVSPVNDAPEITLPNSAYVLNFGGANEYIDLPDYTLSGNMTVEAWIYVDNVYKNWSRVIDFGNGPSSNNIIFGFNGNSGKLFAEVYNGSSSQKVTAPSVFPAGQWVHVACVWNGNTATIYQNGVSVASGSQLSINSVTRVNNYIGKSNWADEYFDGKMTDIRIWTTARTQTEIQNNSNTILTGNEAGLAMYFKASEGLSTYLADYGPGNKWGTFHGTNWVTQAVPVVSVSTLVNTPRYMTGISIDDIDAASGTITLTLGVSHGTLSVSGSVSGGVTAGNIGNNGSATVTVTGTLTAIGATLADANGLQYTPATDYTGTDVLAISLADGGNTGSGGALTDNENMFINIYPPNNSAPVFNNQTMSIQENSPNNTTVGTFGATDADSDPLTYTILSGNTSSAFIVSGSTLRVNNSSVLDYETTTSFTLSVKVSDGTVEDTATVTVNVQNVNESPVFANQTMSIQENSANGTTVGTFTATDPENDGLSYSIVSGNTSSAFSISGATLRVNNTAALDYETTTSFTLIVEVSDGNIEDTATITVNVQNVNESPIFANQTMSIDENSANGTTIGTFTATDPENDGLSYSIVSGNTASAFSISGSTLRVNNTAALDYETTSAFTLIVEVSDGNIEDTATITVDILDVNEAPVFADQNMNIDENSANGTTVGTLGATDVDGNVLTYTILSGNSGAAFAVTGSDIVVSNYFAINYEVRSSFTLTIEVTDGSLTDTATVTVAVNDLNEAPEYITSLSYNIDENSPVTTLGGFITCYDPEGAPLTYTIIGGNTNSAWAISSTGQITVNNSAALDYETQSSWTLNIQVSAGGDTITQAVTISIVDVNEAPVMSDISVSVDEDAYLRLVTASQNPYSDQDGDPVAGFKITALPANGELIINNTGPVTLNTDYSTADLANLVYIPYGNFNGGDSFEINCTDGAQYAASSSMVWITVNAVNDIPVIMDINASTIEDSAFTVLTQFAGYEYFDADTQAPATFWVVSSPAHGTLTVSGTPVNAGDTLAIATAYYLTYTPDANYHGTDGFDFNMSDGTAYAAANATVNITIASVNDAPTAIALNPATVDENQPVGTVVGTLSATDADTGDSHTFQILNNPGYFVLSGNQVVTNDIFNYEGVNTYTIDVIVSDMEGESYTDVLTITIGDVNDSPTAIQLSNNLVDETMSINSLVGILSASDEDNTFTHSFTLVSGSGDDDNASFVINNNVLQSNTTFDYNVQQQYNIRVRVTDDHGATYETTFTIYVNDIGVAPTAVTLVASDVFENEPAGTVVGMLSSVDADNGDTHTYTLVNGPGSAGNGSFVISGNIVETSTTFDYESITNTSIRVRSTDSYGLTYEEVITIGIKDVNEVMTALNLSNTRIAENQPVGTTIGIFSTDDADMNDTHTYTLVAGAGSNDNNSFTISGNTLSSSVVFDYETKDTYSIRVRTTDAAGNSLEAPFIINIADANDAPVGVALDVLTIDENSPLSATIGFFTAVDFDPANQHTFTLVSGVGSTDNGSFSILTNKLQVNDNFDFETRNTYQIRVRATDQGGLWKEETFTITINDVNETPTTINAQTVSIAENQPAGAVVATLSATDVDAGDSHTFGLVSGSGDADNASFSVVGNQVVTNGPLNFEAQSVYSIRLEATDLGGLKVQLPIQITITDANDAPAVATITKVLNDVARVAQYSVREFNTVFNDEDGDQLVNITVTSLPANGVVYLKYAPVRVGDVIDGFNLGNLKYIPNAGFIGTDSFNWTAFDGTDNSLVAQAIIHVAAFRGAGPVVSFNWNNIFSNGHGTQRQADETTGLEELSVENVNLNAYPNPFDGEISISYDLPTGGDVNIRVFDLAGRMVKVLVSEKMDAGSYNINWNGEKVDGGSIAAGQYILQLMITDNNGEVVVKTQKLSRL